MSNVAALYRRKLPAPPRDPIEFIPNFVRDALTQSMSALLPETYFTMVVGMEGDGSADEPSNEPSYCWCRIETLRPYSGAAPAWHTRNAGGRCEVRWI